MVYKKLRLVVLAVFLCSVASCNGGYAYSSIGRPRSKDQERETNEFLMWFQKLPFFVRLLIGLAIDVILFVILYISVRYCCPTCCSKKRPGVILNVTDIEVSKVQPLTDGHSGRRIDCNLRQYRPNHWFVTSV